MIKLELWRTNNSDHPRARAASRLEIAVDGERVHLATVGGQAAACRWRRAGQRRDRRSGSSVASAAQGRPARVVTVAFLDKSATPVAGSAAAVRVARIDRSRCRRRAAGRRGDDHRPFSVTGAGDTPSRRRIFICRPAKRGRRSGACARRSCRRWRAAPTAGRSPTPTSQSLLTFYRKRTRARVAISTAASSAALQRILASPSSCSASSAIRRPRRRHRASHQRPRAGVAAVVLPVEQHPGRRAARPGGSRAGSRSPAVLEQQVRRMLADPRADALVDELRRPVAVPAQPAATSVPTRTSFPDFDDNLRQAFRRETELFFDSIMQRRPQRARSADRRLHVRQRAAGAHYGIPNIYGSQFRRVTLDRRRTAGPARQGQRPDGDLARRPHLAGAARQVGAREPPRRAAAAAAAERAAARRERRRGSRRTMRERMEQHRANPACAGCHKLMDPIGFALENFDAVGALARPRATNGTPIDAVGAARRRHEGRRRRRAAAGAAAASPEMFVQHGDREAADLRARPRPRVLTTCRRCARSSATPRDRTIASRRSCWASSSSAPFQMRKCGLRAPSSGSKAPVRAGEP